jgi:hypothetical protein
MDLKDFTVPGGALKIYEMAQVCLVKVIEV